MTVLGMFRRGANELLRHFGVTIIRLRDLPGGRRIKMMRHHGIETVVDVGGNVGSYGAELRESGYSGRIISFEPTDSAYKKLAVRAGADRLWTVIKAAVGESDGEVTINVAANEAASSSILPMLDLHKQCAPEACFVSTEKVNINTLNKSLRDILPSQDRVLLKIDTQGYEHMVLKGASEIMPQVELIECELSFVQLYEGQLLIREMLDLLKSLGFAPVQMVPGFTDLRSGHDLQVDGIFAKIGSMSV
jgi:FkbM family methyltransferase